MSTKSFAPVPLPQHVAPNEKLSFSPAHPDQNFTRRPIFQNVGPLDPPEDVDFDENLCEYFSD